MFMMIVLVALGAYVITSARANYVFSRRALEWNMAYYENDSKAEEFVMDLDARLASAEKKAVEYVMELGFERDGYEGVSEELQRELAQASESGVNKVLEMLYFAYAADEVEYMGNEYDGVYVDGYGGNDLSVYTNFQSELKSESNISVSLSVLLPDYNLVYEDGSISGSRAENSRRYEIREWLQWQPYQEAGISGTIWDGTVR